MASDDCSVGNGTDRAAGRRGDAPGVAGIGKALLEVAHEVVADARVGLERRLVPEEVGAQGRATSGPRGGPRSCRPRCPTSVAVPAIQEDDAVRPLDERARGNRGEEAVHGGGLVRGRARARRGSARSAARRGAARLAPGRRRRRPSGPRHSTRASSPWLRAKTAPSAKPGGDHTTSLNSSRRARSVQPSGLALPDVQRPLLGEHDEVVAHDQREAVARLARAPAQLARSRRRRR